MPTRSATSTPRPIDGLSLSDLRRVTKPDSRRAEARYKVVERDRVVSRVAKEGLSGLIAHIVSPMLDKGRSVEVRWSHLNRPGMSPWVAVVPNPVTWHRLPEESLEGDIGVKDGRDILHIIPGGSTTTTRCGLDAWYVGLSVDLKAPLEHCPTCFAGADG